MAKVWVRLCAVYAGLIMLAGLSQAGLLKAIVADPLGFVLYWLFLLGLHDANVRGR